MVRHVKFRDLEGVAALILQGLELLTADAQQLAEILLLGFVAVGFVCHFCSPPLYIANAGRHAPRTQRSIFSMR